VPDGRRSGRVERAFHDIDDGGQPIRGVRGGGFARQEVIAQSAQDNRQVGGQSLGRGVVQALAVAPGQRDRPVGGDALGVEVGQGRAG